MKTPVEARCARLLSEVTAGVSSSDLAGIMHWKGEEIRLSVKCAVGPKEMNERNSRGPKQTLKYSVVTTRRPHYSFKNLWRLRLPIPHGRVSPGVMWEKKRLSLKLFTFTTELHVSVPEDLTKAVFCLITFICPAPVYHSRLCVCVCVCVCVFYSVIQQTVSARQQIGHALWMFFWSSCRNQGNSPLSVSPLCFLFFFNVFFLFYLLTLVPRRATKTCQMSCRRHHKQRRSPVIIPSC